jgi:hypothetical protein
MQAQSEGGSTADFAFRARRDWLGSSVWQTPELEVSKVKSWATITAINYHRGDGEGIWRGDRSRLVLAPDQIPPRLLQLAQGRTRQMPAIAPGSLTFFLLA